MSSTDRKIKIREYCINTALSGLYNKREVKDLFNLLYEKIKHGDDEHQKWLKNEIKGFIKEKIK